MIFTISHQSIVYEIPDDWLNEAGATNYKPNSLAYSATQNNEYPIKIKAIADLQAPTRNKGVTWFNKERMISLINGALTGKSLPAIEVHLKPGETKPSVRDGFHRFYMSHALGFNSIPVVILPYFDINEG